MNNVRMTILVMVVVVMAVANIASADIFGTGDNQFTIDFVNISGDASSANGTVIGWDTNTERLFTDPTNDYRIGTYEITNGQWDKFAASVGGTITGSPSDAYDENPHWSGTNVPTNDVSWYEAAQFINYLNTSTDHTAAYKFTGTQGTSGYTLSVWDSGDAGYDSSNPFRNSNAYYFMPTDDEWVKAAYWNDTSLQTLATKDNTVPDEWSPTGGPNSDGQAAGWNYDHAYPNNSSSNDQPWDVTAGYSPEELNGTFDMMGNVLEWMESPFSSGDYLSGSYRSIRGGTYANHTDYFFRSYNGNSDDPSYEFDGMGFRVASIPEPVTLLLLGLGWVMVRRRKMT